MKRTTAYSSASKDVVAKYDNSRELITALRKGETVAIETVYDLLGSVILYFTSKYPGTKEILSRTKDLHTKYGLFSHLIIEGKISLSNIDCNIGNIKGYIWKLAYRELYDWSIKKGGAKFSKRLLSLDATIGDSETTRGDLLADSLEDVHESSAEDKVRLVEEYIKGHLVLNDRCKMHYDGLKSGKTKKELLLDFKDVSLENGSSDTNDKGWSDRYDLSLHRCKEYLNGHIPYKQLISE